ncbi:glucan 1,3-beta-glucosidase [Purpureocillium lavendulum]|uniref:Probable glucan endo-1,3-beta-glucosidase eglC n=1 Tax=Purpureocillium lavendulum TaxID=1247861 RepID=A0AB34FYY6_9HYPO|nr:glucan 1,3-beta-glucosidase [Purpureocillium lavendulum]
MPSSAHLLTLATAVSSAAAAFQGFNYGSTFTDGRVKSQQDFESEFKTAASLDGTNGGFTSARLYTMVQGGTPNDPISAIPAAISTKTSLLLGLWASAGEASFKNELAALQKTIDQYCGKLDGLIAGISVGSEDLYRISPIGQAASPDPGASPDTLVSYVKQVRDTIKGSCLQDAPIGHVDTWTVYVNETNKPVIDAIDWVGMDAYPYYENTKPNELSNAKSLFQAALDKTKGVSGGKPVWITETGWPVSGDKSGAAVPSTDNAKVFWDEVGCPMFGKTNVWWFTLQDGSPTTPNPAFGVIGSELTTKPLYDLSCDNVDPSPSSTSAVSSSSKPSSTAVPSASSSAQSEQPSTSSADSGSGSGSVSNSAPAATTTAQGGSVSSSAPAPGTTVSTVVVPPPVGGNTSSAGGSVPTGTNPAGQPTAPTGTGAQPTASPSSIPTAAAGRVNSIGAAAVAIVMAAAVI